MKQVVSLGLFLSLILSTASAATRPSSPANFRLLRFASPDGSAANDGFTTNTPWSLSYALTQAGPTTSITLLPGTYPSIEITQPGTKLVSLTKWGAKIIGSSGSHGIWTDPAVGDVILDGIQIANSSQDGISLNGSNCVVRNCWIHDSSSNGVSSSLNMGTLLERNLIEHNGMAVAPGQKPGIALSGTNCIVRGNVIRYNQGWGCQIYAAAPASSGECQVYNNLIYSNGAGVTVWSPAGQTNYVFNNTIISSTNTCLCSDYGTLYVTNNILVAGVGIPLIKTIDGATALSDYNLVNLSTSPGGPHDVVNSNPGFVNASAGLYWLANGSPAVGLANPTVVPPVDFFGKLQSAVVDVGAVQYSSALAADQRVLDPSTSSGADYWVAFTNSTTLPGGVAPLITLQPKDQTRTAGENATFTVAATGAGPLTYQWTWNGENDGNNSSTYTAPDVLVTDSGAIIQVTVQNANGAVQSTLAVLTVQPGATPPAIAAQPQNQVVIAGQSATFGVAATGDAPLSYQWTFNGSTVGSSSSSYTRSNCQLGDNGGIVQVTVSNPNGSVQSSSATLKVNAQGTYYFVSPDGKTSNTGLSTDSPWPLAYALNNHNGPGVTIYLMDGLYNAGQQTTYSPVGMFQFHNTKCTPSNPMTVRAINKWKAIIAYGTSGGIGAATSTGYATAGVVFDGLQVCSNAVDGVTVCYSSVIRNCWIHDNQENGVNSTHPNCTSNIFELNLIEHNGVATYNLYHFHGLYISGPFHTVRNNVLRENRDGTDIQIYTEDAGNTIYGNMVYGNLIYGGTKEGYCADIFGATYNGVVGGASPGTNYAFNNTIIGGLYTHYGTLCFTNNILIPAPGNSAFMGTGSGSKILGDYNAGVTTLLGSPHEIVTSLAGLGFVNPSAGLYWPTSSSILRGRASSTIGSLIDFFGNSQSSDCIGAFQYSATLANDSRVLDPSPANPDYWSAP
jgi:hypothetical protein